MAYVRSGLAACAALLGALGAGCGGSTSSEPISCAGGRACPAGYVCSARGECVPGADGGTSGVGGGGGDGGLVGNGGVGGGGFGGNGGMDPVAPGAQPPPKPNVPGSPSAQLTVLAFNRLLLGDTDRTFAIDAQAWKQYGYNLDGIISTKAGSNHCRLTTGSVPTVKVDGYDGIDNSFGANLVPIFGALVSDLSKSVSSGIATGNFTYLWRLTNYDGLVPDDSDVQAALYAGAPLGFTPTWSGSDVWPVSSDSVIGGNINQPKLSTAGAYVADGTLVSRFEQLSLQLWIQGFPLVLPLENPVLTVQISGVGPSAKGHSGVIAGVLPTEALIAELKKMGGYFDTSLCSSQTFDSIAVQFRQSSDIMADGTNGDPNQMCNAISIGIGFDASAVQLGSVAPALPPPPDPCMNP